MRIRKGRIQTKTDLSSTVPSTRQSHFKNKSIFALAEITVDSDDSVACSKRWTAAEEQESSQRGHIEGQVLKDMQSMHRDLSELKQHRGTIIPK